MSLSTSRCPLSITEILENIGQFLDPCDLFNCIQVSKTWLLVLKPSLFQDIQILYNIPNQDDIAIVRSPPSEYALANSNSTQRLTVINSPVNGSKINIFRAFQFPQLVDFTWTASLSHRGVDESNWNHMIAFVKSNNTKLRRITIEIIYRSSLVEFYKVLALDCSPTLRHLSLQKVNFSTRSLAWFWVACRSLESLGLQDIHIPPIRMDQSCENVQFVMSHIDEVLQANRLQECDDLSKVSPLDVLKLPNMKHLSLSGIDSMDSQMALIKCCPRLESIDWDGEIEVDTPAFELLNIMISYKNYQSLHSVTLKRLLISDDDMVKIIFDLDKNGQRDSGIMRSFRLLRTLRIPNTCFGQKSLMELKRCGHYNTIQDLNLRLADIGSRDILEILTSCPSLKSLIAPKLHAADIVKDKQNPWVCLDLQKFEVCIETSIAEWVSPFFLSDELAVCPSRNDPATSRERLYNIGPPSEQEMQETSLGQIGRLRQLKSLKIASGGSISSPSPRKGIILELAQGLDLLKGLKRLEELSFKGNNLREEEIMWMFLHWENFKRVNIWENTPDSSNNNNKTLKWIDWTDFIKGYF